MFPFHSNSLPVNFEVQPISPSLPLIGTGLQLPPTTKEAMLFTVRHTANLPRGSLAPKGKVEPSSGVALDTGLGVTLEGERFRVIRGFRIFVDGRLPTAGG